MQESLSPVKSVDAKTSAAMVPKKDASQWCDVGILKGTTSVVSYYHLTSDIAQGNGEVSYVVGYLALTRRAVRCLFSS